ncbi:hypothetical protein BDN67DRAFT_985375 [Paxillus ammoniavirescens]|nr:hypothetical protein BDN67DRAFT_985375 [Paxillus ammoniavirescens]
MELDDARYVCLLGVIQALHDKVERARVLERLAESPMCTPKLQLLAHFADHCLELFQKKLRVHPLIFNDILDQISDHPIFQNHSNNKQLLIAIQLGIFLNRLGHYRNTCFPEDIAQWAGVSVGTVINCTHHVTAAILDQHDQYIYMPSSHQGYEMSATVYRVTNLPIVEKWSECCLILHNMIIQFEEQHKGEMRGTMDWAIVAGQEVDDGQGDQIYNQAGGTEGQRFHGHLMERLFEKHGLWF